VKKMEMQRDGKIICKRGIINIIFLPSFFGKKRKYLNKSHSEKQQ